MMMVIMWGMVVLLFLFKFLGIVFVFMKCCSEFGGVWVLIKGVVLELIMVVFIVLLMMFYYSYFVISVFVGYLVKWEV